MFPSLCSSSSLLEGFLLKLTALIIPSHMAVMHSSVIVSEVTQCVNTVGKHRLYRTYAAARHASSCGKAAFCLLTNKQVIFTSPSQTASLLPDAKGLRMQQSVFVQFLYNYLLWETVRLLLSVPVITLRAHCQSNISSEKCLCAEKAESFNSDRSWQH